MINDLAVVVPKWKWLRSTDFVVLSGILVTLALGASAFGQFVLYAFAANRALNSLILGALCVGSGLIYQQSFLLFRERFAIRWWFEYLHKHHRLAEDRPLFVQECVVNDMLLRLDRVNAFGGDSLNADMIEREAERIESRLERNQDLCRFMVGLMVALGLLGTFVGLLETLVQVSALVGSIGEGIATTSNAEISMANVILGLKNPMAAMGTAFSASMFGLIGSIVLGLQMVRLSKSTLRTHTDVRTYGLKALDIVAKNLPRQRSLEEVLQQYLGELAEQGRQVSSSFGVVAKLSELTLPKLGDLNVHIQDTAVQSMGFVEALHMATDSLREFGTVSAQMREVAVASRDTAAHLAQSNRALERIGDVQHQLAASSEALLNTMRMGLNQIAETNQSIAQAVAASERTTLASHDNLVQALDRLRHSQDNHATNGHADQLALCDAQEAVLTALRALHDAQDAQAQALHDTMESIATAQARSLEYMAGFHSHVTGVPGLARDLRAVIAELPRRDEALASFSTAVERFANLHSAR